jgi:hypothetical protein
MCTTSPSTRRNQNGGEWPFISPVHLSPVKVPEQLEHSFLALGKSPPAIAGAVSAHGNLVAMLENTGKLILCSLAPSSKGGICPSGTPVILNKMLSQHKNSLMSTTSMRFHLDKGKMHLHLYAVDIKGKVIRKSFASCDPK